MNGIDLEKLETIPSGFIVIAAIMIVIAAVLLLIFLKKQWLTVSQKKHQKITVDFFLVHVILTQKPNPITEIIRQCP
jgi:hypothetical protein